MPLPEFLQDKKAVRFAVISSLIVIAALAAAVVSAAAAQLGEYDLASLTSKIALALALVIALYVVPRLAQNVRLELLRANLSLDVTSAGWIFCTFIIVVGIASLSTGNNLLYLILAILLATLVVSGIASRVNINDTDVALRFPDHIFAGEKTRLEIAATGHKKFIPSFSLSVAIAAEKVQRGFWQKKKKESKIAAQLRRFAPLLAQPVCFPIIPGGAEAHTSLECSFARRGIYPVRGFTIRSRFPFGFVERRRFIEASGEIIVYPQPQPLDDFYHLLPITQGQMESPLKGSGSDLYAIRQYLTSDHLRHVDWKATARTAQLMVREYTRDDDWRITIAFDHYAIAETAEFSEKFEGAVTLAASLITHFMAEGAEVRLVTGRDDLGFGRDEAHRYKLLRHLARLAPVTEKTEQAAKPEREETISWSLLERLPTLAADDQFRILITPAPRGSIPASVWRAAHVVYFDDLRNSG
ncbi:MAG: DUF58 domain-containing protein [Blastocatellia bacterium]